MKKIFYAIFGIALMAVSCSTPNGEATKSGLLASNFVDTVDGKPTALYTLTNKAGMEVCVTNFGGRIVSVMVPDKDGKFHDVVLGHDSIKAYVADPGNFGALIGRYGNRINKGKFTLDSVDYQLPLNNYGHCLHGGTTGYDRRVWDARQIDNQNLELTLVSPDGEMGFPGTLNIKVVYSLSDDNALSITYGATTDKPTIVNLTNHSYFNLSGDLSKPILDEVVTFNADGFTPIDSTFMTDGSICPVDGTPFDFREGRTVGQDIESNNQQLFNGLGYDHNMVLNTKGDISKVAASVYDKTTGIFMEVYTNEPGIQFYVGNFLDGTVKGKNGIAYPKRSAMCLESQHYPDSPNQPNYPSVVVRPGEEYSSKCVYKFSVK